MIPEPYSAPAMIQALLGRGWRWSETEENVLVHPTDHDLALRYDPVTEKLSVSPKLVAHLTLVIPTPASKLHKGERTAAHPA